MAEVLVIGKKISEMGLVNEITGEEKIPTSALGDKAVTTSQLLTYLNNNGVAQWGRIGGDITNQVDLQNQFTQQLVTLQNHIQDQGNPHNVTKEQIGLGLINNTSDMDKPVSTAVQEALSQKADQTYVDDYLANKTHNSLLGRDMVGAHPASAILDETGQSQQVVNNSKADKSETLEGYGILDAYTKDEVDNNLDQKADKYGFRWSNGTAGQESAINTIMGYADNAIAPNVRGAHVQQGSRNNENIIGGDASTVGADVPNVVDTSKTYNAHYAIVGGYDNVNNVLAGVVIGYHCKALDDGTGAAGATHATILGGSYHTFVDGDYSAAVGGTNNLLDYKSGGAYSFFGAGIRGVIKARFSTIISSDNSRIGGTNGAELTNSGIYHSNISTIDGNYATVLGGNECKAVKDYTFARGKGAVANNVGESVFSTGKFKTVGDSGQSTLHLLRQTTNQTQTQLLCSDEASGNTITPLGVKTSILVKALVTAYNVTTDSTSAFEIVAHMSRDSENVVLNAHTVTPIYNPESLAVAIVPSTTLFQVRVTGLAANTINWTCKLEQVWSRSV